MVDAQIAATTLAGGFVLATRNVGGFEAIDGLSLVNPFTGPALTVSERQFESRRDHGPEVAAKVQNLPAGRRTICLRISISTWTPRVLWSA